MESWSISICTSICEVSKKKKKVSNENYNFP